MCVSARGTESQPAGPALPPAAGDTTRGPGGGRQHPACSPASRRTPHLPPPSFFNIKHCERVTVSSTFSLTQTGEK